MGNSQSVVSCRLNPRKGFRGLLLLSSLVLAESEDVGTVFVCDYPAAACTAGGTTGMIASQNSPSYCNGSCPRPEAR